MKQKTKQVTTNLNRKETTEALDQFTSFFVELVCFTILKKRNGTKLDKKPFQKGHLQKLYSKEEITEYILGGHNIGINLEKSNLIVFDIDLPKDKSLRKYSKQEYLKTLLKEYPFLRKSLIVETPNGYHIDFHLSKNSKIKKSRYLKIIPILDGCLDILSSGYVVCPPSVFDNKQYKVLEENKVQTLSSDEEDLIFNLINKHTEKEKNNKEAIFQEISKDKKPVEEAIKYFQSKKFFYTRGNRVEKALSVGCYCRCQEYTEEEEIRVHKALQKGSKGFSTEKKIRKFTSDSRSNLSRKWKYLKKENKESKEIKDIGGLFLEFIQDPLNPKYDNLKKIKKLRKFRSKNNKINKHRKAFFEKRKDQFTDFLTNLINRKDYILLISDIEVYHWRITTNKLKKGFVPVHSNWLDEWTNFNRNLQIEFKLFLEVFEFIKIDHSYYHDPNDINGDNPRNYCKHWYIDLSDKQIKKIEYIIKIQELRNSYLNSINLVRTPILLFFYVKEDSLFLQHYNYLSSKSCLNGEKVEQQGKPPPLLCEFTKSRDILSSKNKIIINITRE